MRLGIDFGTTRTVVACADRGNYPVLAFCDQRGDSVDWFPSVVAERDGALRFGFEAEACDAGWTVIRSFKRWLASGDHDREVQVGGLRLPLVELLARFLSAVRDAIALRSSLPSSERLEAAIAVPANAHSTQRFVTLEAFRRAGFAVRAMLNEPSAAGFEYTHRYADTLNARRESIVVYDLGGGTFDASLVRMQGRHHDALATAGANRLGGDDYDAVLAEMVLAASGAPNVIDRALLDACRAAKEALNPSSRKLVVDVGGETVTLPVADYYQAVAPLTARTLAVMQPLVAPDGVDRDDLAGVYIVGGASALPAVARALRDRFGRRAHRSPYPFASIAIGLAIAADGEAGYALTDRLSRHFGVFREADGGRDVAFDVIVPPKTELPSTGTVSLAREYRAAHNIGHFRFVECSAVAGTTPTGDVTPLGEVLFPFDARLRDRPLDGVPVERIGDGPPVREVYAIDPHGIVAVTITDLASGFRREFRLG